VQIRCIIPRIANWCYPLRLTV